jgi:tagatose-1,6-bisphosphate aldolase non-catalytic subunit AgaZ/GatZ
VLDWNQRTFIADLQRIAKKVGFTGLLYPCRDHGGPWQRDEERGARLPEAEAMAKAKESFLEDLLAGYSLLHIDPTKDPHVSGQVAMEVVLRRTVELLEYVEGERVERKLPAISYEIGTEETAGGLIGDQAFEKFIVDLLAQLDAKGLPHPAFIVGQTGTLVKMDRNVGKFDADTAQRLAAIARRHGIGFKEHNGDYLPMDVLEAHPGLGLTATNVAPEFGLDETVALLQLADQEQRSGGPSSGFLPLIQERAIASGRWKKWLLPEDAGLTEEQILQSPEKIRLVTRVCGQHAGDRSRA